MAMPRAQVKKPTAEELKAKEVQEAKEEKATALTKQMMESSSFTPAYIKFRSEKFSFYDRLPSTGLSPLVMVAESKDKEAVLFLFHRFLNDKIQLSADSAGLALTYDVVKNLSRDKLMAVAYYFQYQQQQDVASFSKLKEIMQKFKGDTNPCMKKIADYIDKITKEAKARMEAAVRANQGGAKDEQMLLAVFNDFHKGLLFDEKGQGVGITALCDAFIQKGGNKIESATPPTIETTTLAAAHA